MAQSAVSAFVQSLNPHYDPTNSRPPVPDVADSAAGIDFPGRDGQTSDYLQFITLAGRAIAACANLPPTINNALGYLVNLAVAGQFASDQFNSVTAHAGLVPEPGTHRENTPDAPPENTKNNTRKTSKNPRQQPGKPVTTTHRAGQLPKTSLALGALASLSSVGGSAPAATSDTAPWVKVADAETLSRVCHDVESCGNKYQLTKDIDGSQLTQPIGNKTHPFTGKLDGNGHTIGNLFRCLVEHLSAEGSIENLSLIDANINSTAPAGVAACEMSGDARISNIHVERACVATRGENATAAVAVGKINKGTVTNTTAANCRVETSGNKTDAGIGAGYQLTGTVTNTTALNCTVTTSGEDANAGIGAGRSHATVTDTTAVDCTVSASGEYSNAGIGAGRSYLATVTNTTALNCRVRASGKKANAGIGAGHQRKGNVIETAAVNCTVKTSGSSKEANAGIKETNAGIGAGYLAGGNDIEGNVIKTTAVNCWVIGEKANAGIGVGARKNKANVIDTTAVNCTVITSGKEANAGIGAGSIQGKGSTANTTVINSFVNSTDNAPSPEINGGDNPVICNVSINGIKQTYNRQACIHWLNNTLFCEDLDRRLVTRDCQAVNTGIDTSNGTNALPSSPVTETLATVPGTTMNVSSPGSITLTTPPTTGATTPGMTFSSPDSATFAKSTPLVQSLNLNTVVLACITLGALFVVLIGVYTYRYCNQRSSARAGRNHPMPWQPDDRSMTGRPLPAPPQNHCDLLLVRPENTATGCSSAMANAGKESDQQRPDRPDVLNEDESIYSLYEPMGVRQAGMAKGGSNFMVNTGKQPDPGQQRPDRPDELNEDESIDSLYEPMGVKQASMAKGGSNFMVNTGKQPAPGQQRPPPPVYENVSTRHKSASRRLTENRLPYTATAPALL